jgi:peptidyl-prolyl cis-trans isomerase B (cyclophilin B)
VIVAVALVVLVAAGSVGLVTLLGGDDGSTDQAADDQSSTAEQSTPEDPCDAPEDGKPTGDQWDKEPAVTIDKSAKYTMKLATTCGDIDIALKASAAPHTVNSFNFLVGKGYLDHTKCHRLVPSGIYVLQCGDPQGTGQGGPGYTIPDEPPSWLQAGPQGTVVYPRGTVAMAKTSAPNSGGSQFFLVYEDSTLPPDYTPFGTVTEGMDVLQKIADAGSTTDPYTYTTVPNATVVINEATVKRRDEES